MKYNEFNICDKNGKSNCVIRTFCKIFNKKYDNVYNELCNIARKLNCDSYNDIEVFEIYMKKYGVIPIDYGKNLKVRDLKLNNGKYIVFCFDKNNYYHMVPIINNILYDKDNKSLNLYVIKLYKEINKGDNTHERK